MLSPNRAHRDKDGEQQVLFSHYGPGQLPITPLRHPGGEWLRLEIVLRGELHDYVSKIFEQAGTERGGRGHENG